MALRIANVPEAEFEEAIERDQSPSVTEMAERAVRRMGELLRGILAAKK